VSTKLNEFKERLSADKDNPETSKSLELFKVNKLFLSKTFLKSVKLAFFKNSDL
jgi:hypothetical protein